MIHIAQCLCEKRHCIIAFAYDTSEGPPEKFLTDLQAAVEEAVRTKALNPWCGICNSRVFHYEDGATPFHSMEEAKPYLKAAERMNLQTRAILQGMKNQEENSGTT
jgi:hypothetical protein